MTSLNENTRWLFDKVYGTRQYTQGAELQLPRKVPIRVEPKSYFANERTFLSWVGMAVTLGGVSSALVGFSGNEADSPSQLISKRTIDMITCVFTPLSVLIMAYALFTFEWRSKCMRQKQIGFFDDKFGPVFVAVLVTLTLLAIFAITLYDFFY
mmetsp:Transcript_34101/g.61480  ORF Transcript_34101/g.61480 Transcript_34101/m.61480 type:complete len:154 (-) Transcript_34101:567-1028(-)|eukprot:CAMPEP_0175066030 /NCGR_PEP_ID=MMETSP0052_2-20121109/16275_1 /TAXON_ID=51329 ORGANISM="Polytomella parva, Strain SAG 63-3" /NCGR_SAMPLE_ID=MMETSP0052_2 /ASSEMBLY_ACC=CAM_ASM_000194 /LENGTH=153 /DNA_ID=CAMNT_0016332673 /DNA_START=95 /DNA_END=556 /DNA_ORIENTATION=+